MQTPGGPIPLTSGVCRSGWSNRRHKAIIPSPRRLSGERECLPGDGRRGGPSGGRPVAGAGVEARLSVRQGGMPGRAGLVWLLACQGAHELVELVIAAPAPKSNRWRRGRVRQSRNA